MIETKVESKVTYTDEMNIGYGARVYDDITQYEGKVTAFCHYYGKQPDQYLVEGIDQTRRPVSMWVSADRIRVGNGHIQF